MNMIDRLSDLAYHDFAVDESFYASKFKTAGEMEIDTSK